MRALHLTCRYAQNEPPPLKNSLQIRLVYRNLVKPKIFRRRSEPLTPLTPQPPQPPQMDLIWQVLHPQMPLFDYSLFFFLGGVSRGWSLASMIEPFFCDTVHLSSFCSQLALKASAAKTSQLGTCQSGHQLEEKTRDKLGSDFCWGKTTLQFESSPESLHACEA